MIFQMASKMKMKTPDIDCGSFHIPVKCIFMITEKYLITGILYD